MWPLLVCGLCQFIVPSYSAAWEEEDVDPYGPFACSPTVRGTHAMYHVLSPAYPLMYQVQHFVWRLAFQLGSRQLVGPRATGELGTNYVGSPKHTSLYIYRRGVYIVRKRSRHRGTMISQTIACSAWISDPPRTYRQAERHEGVERRDTRGHRSERALRERGDTRGRRAKALRGVSYYRGSRPTVAGLITCWT